VARLTGGDDQRAFRRIALNRPAALAFLQDGIVGAVGAESIPVAIAYNSFLDRFIERITGGAVK
jgi:hypothetical protein